MKPIIVLTLFALASCGAGGAPIKPSPKTGMTISGQASVGIARDGG